MNFVEIPKDLTPKEKKALKEFNETCQRIHDGSAPPINETTQAKEKRKAHLLKLENIEEWVEHYFKSEEEDFDPAPLAWYHWDLLEAFFVKKKRKIALEAHRESAKSVLMDIFIPIRMLMLGELTGMILASETADKANDLISDVEAQLRSNRRIIADYGDFGITGSWLRGSFQTKKGIGFWAFGLGTNPSGVRKSFRRPNLGVVDDADSYKKSKNPTWAVEQANWVKGEFLGCLAKDDRRLLYGNNRVHKSGLTAHFVGDVTEDDEVDPSVYHIKAYLTEDPETHEPIYPEGRTEEEVLDSLKLQGAAPAWDEFYSLEDAAYKVVDYGPVNSLRQLYHKHVVPGTLFNDDNMPWVDPLPLSEYDAIVDYMDPAFGESGKGSYKSLIRVGKTEHYYDVLKVWLSKLGEWWNIQYEWAQEIEVGKDGLIPKVKRYQSWVECNSLQKTELRKTYILANLNRDTHWYPRYDTNHKGDKVSRIEGIVPGFDEKIWRFNARLRKNAHMVALRDQFKGFPNGMIDGPDSAQGAKIKLDRIFKPQSKGGTNTRVGQYEKDKSHVG